MRIEADCIGKLAVPDDALYGIHTLRAVHNFPITTELMHPLIMQSLVQIKKAAASVNAAAGTFIPTMMLINHNQPMILFQRPVKWRFACNSQDY